MQVSVIIPTYNRQDDVNKCLNSIIIQTSLPMEILIIDDSENNDIENLIECIKNEFEEKKLLLKYIKNKKEKGITIARNIGIKNATGDIILFLDSDTILDRDYIKEVMKVYEEHEEALGVQGMVQEQKSKRFIDKLLLGYATLFFIRFDEKNKFRLLPSYGVSTPTIVDKVINCEWLSGANNSWRREIFNDFEFDENLKRYSWGEDTDTSYRVYKKYPDSLFLTPHAKIIHKGSSDGRHLKKDIIYMDYVYYTYLFYKNIDQTTKNKLIYIWSRLGRLGLDVLSSAYQSDSKIEEIKHRICAPFYCLKHIKEIRAGDLEFFNKGLR